MFSDEIFMDGFEAGATNLGRVFDYLNGYSEGERTLSFKYLDTVPKDQQNSIINEVCEARKIYFSSSFFSISESINHISMLKAKLI